MHRQCSKSPVLVGVDFEGLPDLLSQTRVGIQHGECRQQYLVQDVQELVVKVAPHAISADPDLWRWW